MVTVEYAAELDPLLDLSPPSDWVVAVIPELSQTLAESAPPEDRLFAELFSGDEHRTVATRMAFIYYRGIAPTSYEPSRDNQISVKYDVERGHYELWSTLESTTVSTSEEATTWLEEQFTAVESFIETYRTLDTIAEEIHGLGQSGVRGLVETFGTLDNIRQADIEAMADVPYVDEEIAQELQSALGEAYAIDESDPTSLESALGAVNAPLILSLRDGPLPGDLVPSDGSEPRFRTDGLNNTSSGDTEETSDLYDRFVVEIGVGTAAHIIDMDADNSDTETASPFARDLPGEMMCSRGNRSPSSEQLTFPQFADRRGIEPPSLEGEPPEGICSYCWSNTLETIGEQQEQEEDGVTERIGTVGYRLRWKQKGRARDEWYDVIVAPDATFDELDRLVCRFTTLGDFHLRMYGLEDEYLDSSLNILPDHQYESVGDFSYTKASEVTIGQVAEQTSLWEGDRLSMVYDFGTPSHYYCIVKEVYEPEEIEQLLESENRIVGTDRAAIVREKRP